jgi:hypothetical protein
MTERWYVVCSTCATDPQPEDRIWTISRKPDEEGWITDGGYPGYGLTKAEAEELTAAANMVRSFWTYLSTVAIVVPTQ